MKLINDIWFSFLIIALSGIVFTLLAPYFPIAETRYLTVAWEMKLHHSFIVPLLHGLPYSDKPPFLFWLINLDWFLLGINEKTLRLIPVLFSLANIVMVYRIALMLWKDKKIAEYATVIFSSTLIYLTWSALIMFDVILTFWVLVGISGLLSAAKNEKRTSWLLIAISIGGGVLTKGPVIFAYILPVSILCFLWVPKNKLDMKKWYLKILLSFFIGIAIALLWAIPAVMIGGEKYREAILWGQTANRFVSSFAHQRPLWWYIPFLPVLFFPWILLKPAWSGHSSIKHDKNYSFLITWILSTIILFSLISCKQIYYLIPIVPAVSLLIAKNIATYSEKVEEYAKWHYPVAIVYIILGIAVLLLQFTKFGGDVGSSLVNNNILMTAIGIIFLGSVLFFVKTSSTDKLIKITALSSIAVIIIILVGTSAFLGRYNIKKFAQILKEKQEDGYKIVHYRKYDGQYHFLGRLTQPFIVLNNKKSIGEYVKTHKKVLLITYEKPGKVVDENEVVYQQLCRGKKVILWKKTESINSKALTTR